MFEEICSGGEGFGLCKSVSHLNDYYIIIRLLLWYVFHA